jgi:competence protein ComEC
MLVLAPVLPLLQSRHALLCTLSVGQGDAAVLRTHGGHWLVFDGGPASSDWDAGSSILLPFLRTHGATHIDLAILSHPDLDHVGGLIGLLGNMSITRVLDSGHPLPSAPYQRFLALVDASGSKWLPAVSGDSLSLGGVTILILGPEGRPASDAGGANETSIVFRVEFEGGFRYLNTGDATVREEHALLLRWPTEMLRSDLLKVGHHGSRTSSAVSFVEIVHPSIAVISSGARNSYGHPYAETLARLDTANVPRIWRTDRHGSLCIEINRQGLWRVAGEGRWRAPDPSP